MADKKQIESLLRITREDLKDLESYIREYSAFLPLAVCTINPLGIILNNNRSFQKLTGYKNIENIGRKLEDLFLNKKNLRELIKKGTLKEKTNLSQKMLLLTKKGKKIPVNMAISTRKDEENNFIGFFIAISDITVFEDLRKSLEKKVIERTRDLKTKTKEIASSRTALMNILEDVERAKVEMEEERDKTVTIFENLPQAIFFFDRKNNVASANPEVNNFFDLKSEKIVGKNIKDFKNNKKLNPLFNILGEEIKGIYRKELVLKKNLILEVSAIPVMREREKMGTLVILRNITREKTIERLKTEFVSISAHQLRTPLSAVKWTLKMILDEDLGGITKEQRKFIEKTYKSNERMIRLINDLLNVARIEEGRFLYDIKDQNIIEIAQEAIAVRKRKIKRKKINFRFEKPKKKIPKVKVDSEKISIVFQNLLDNAIHYTKPGDKIVLSIKYLKDKKNISVFVKDTGIGIPKSQQKRIFQRFFRSSEAVKMKTAGTGLGLFITKNIVEAHGGKIWFESVENEGSTFYFTLPVHKK